MLPSESSDTSLYMHRINTMKKIQLSILLLSFGYSFLHKTFSVYKGNMGMFQASWESRPIAGLTAEMCLGTLRQMGETLWTWRMEDTLPGSQPAPALWSEPGAPGLVQPGQAGAWGHLTAAPSAYKGPSGSQDLSEGHSEAQVRLRPAIRKPLPRRRGGTGCPGTPSLCSLVWARGWPCWEQHLAPGTSWPPASPGLPHGTVVLWT